MGETVIYEAHVKGLTLLNPQLPEAIRGTYKALGHPAMIAYFKSLGISALELLPVAQFASEPRLQRMGLSNYWGYNPLAWFALDPRYASDPDRALDEFRDAVKALHAAGIEVILDIVLNHSAEIDLDGPTVSLRGIDNRSYYWVREDGDYHNWTGCGNTLNLSHPGVVEWARQCLRFWVDECHVDGFRFDLASVMGRTPEFRRGCAAVRGYPPRQRAVAGETDCGTLGISARAAIRWVISHRCSLNGMTIFAIAPDASGYSKMSPWGILPNVSRPPAISLPAMASRHRRRSTR